ncbi:MAG: hypothetical protein JSR11_03735 [Bacteroidetes bacterium]|nr:hypothetical protein [Bacteroidota bacterium]
MKAWINVRQFITCTTAKLITKSRMSSVSRAFTNALVVRCCFMSNKIEIIGVGYGKEVNEGESYLQETVINMWSFAPDSAFTYYSANGSLMILQEYTKTGKDTFNTRTLLKEEVTTEIKNVLVVKGQCVFK